MDFTLTKGNKNRPGGDSPIKEAGRVVAQFIEKSKPLDIFDKIPVSTVRNQPKFSFGTGTRAKKNNTF
jgi:hypothetical protein